MSDVAFEPGFSRSEALRRATQALKQAGHTEARGDARFLCLHLLGLTPTDLALRGDAPIGPAGADALTQALTRRLRGEPVARILGEWEFRGLTFALSAGTLVPRPDTETLVDSALRLGTVPSPTILDLGTGSGCILIALLGEWPGARGLGVDLSEDALSTARTNAARNGVGDRAAFLRGDWCEAVRGPFDLIVSNPPYIASGVIPTLSEEVRRYDPAAALDGGPDGLDAYRAIVDGLAARPGLLAADGALLLEIGYDQAEAVAGLGRDAGFRVAGIDRDLTGHARVVTLRPPFDVTSVGNKVVR
ncbi:peptide chain release factor N(5)-glutamine methyltransferase [Methylobacterium haplocladii]|uniref:Release factor glutamine methyltransferase n=1 Tax=Methylobacterium haplocladii TaxID=1176176 RepID=A0A512IQI2_9HYPH|nr:peptide chain release factor N(5)-glutamine methyltransferase [Methylobacterium haplocladii]GEO99878.1 release factor glutamine methyltransferase [Methylobacterium haplocladii]GJD82762.1 Release factor glutamine methyltransferase [Methylobacterium haplocladii]GLS58042.1 release factor glutamine methyltransferase [Methylobacterium haplocladii]